MDETGKSIFNLIFLIINNFLSDRLRDELKKKDEEISKKNDIIAKKEKKIADMIKSFGKLTTTFTAIKADFMEVGSESAESSSASSETVTSVASASTRPRSVVRMVSSRAIQGRAPVSSLDQAIRRARGKN